jgi:hypothetical protein
MFADKLKEGYTKSSESMVYTQRLRNRVKRKTTPESPVSYILTREKEAKRIAYDANQLQKFVNGFDNLSISLLQPYIMFEKYNKKRNQTFYLNMQEANLASFRSFLDGSLRGRGSIGFEKRKNPGGFGIRSLELEYLTSEKSGYSFNHYKLELEVFCASMEDLVANLGTEGDAHTMLDVLIAFPEDIKRMQQDISDGQTGGELASAFKTVMELGYNVADSDKEFVKKSESSKSPITQKMTKDIFSSDGQREWKFTKGRGTGSKIENSKNFSEQTKMLAQRQDFKTSLEEDNFTEQLKGLRFRVFLTPYKWTFDVQQKGNIVLKISYMGYDNMVSSGVASNVMATHDEVKTYQKKYKKKASKSPTVDSARSAKELDEAKKQAKKDQEKDKAEKSGYLKTMQPLLCLRPYQELGLMERSFDLVVDFDALSIKKPDGDTFFGKIENNLKELLAEKFGTDAFMEGFAKMFKGYGITPKDKWETDYDFEKIMDNSKYDAQLTIENKQIDTKASADVKVSIKANPEARNFYNVIDISTGATYITYIPYFYLGDLLALLSVIVAQNLQSSGEFAQGTHVRFVTDKLVFPAPWFEGAQLEMNISEIPISWDFFMEWWRKKILAKTSLIYKLEEFLQEFFGHFLQSLFKKSDLANAININIGCHCIVKDIEEGKNDGPKHISYYLYQKVDDPEPMVRFYIGSARGLLKDIQFEVIEDSYLSSANMQMAEENEIPDNNLQFQRAIYNCSITTFGNAIFQPGMTVEVVPSIIGVPFSDTPDMRNIYDLGIGGMYAVTSTKVSLRQGNFETKLTTRWVSKPVAKVVWGEGGDEQIMDQIYSNYGSGGYTSSDQDFSVVKKPVPTQPGPVK